MTGERGPASGPVSGLARDIVVVGASAGGVEALMRLVGELQAGMHASIFVVLHMAADARSSLASILNRSGALPVLEPRDGMAVRHGFIYVARPNYHMLLERGRVRILAGPRENGARPAVDPLFRSAAWAYGERVVGVVLSGSLDDGTAGARVIRRHGGLVVAQSDALFPSMPRSVVESGLGDQALPAAEIGRLLVGLAAAESATGSAVVTEGANAMAANDLLEDQMEKPEGAASGFTCPECNGSLWERVEPGADGEQVVTFECRVDHRYTFDTLVAAKAQEVEASVWAAINALEERAALLRKSAERARSRGLALSEVPDRMLTQAREAEEHAEAIRKTLLGSLAAVANGGEGMNRDREVGPISP